MDDALPVRRIQCLTDLPRILQRLRNRERARERLALDVLHNQIVRPDIVELAYIRMVECSDRLSLARKPLVELVVALFDRHKTVEAAVSGLPHFTHTARAQRRQNLVRTELIACCQRHMAVILS